MKEKDELDSNESAIRQQSKSFRAVFGKWVKVKEMEASCIKRVRDAIQVIKVAHLTKTTPRAISHDVLTDKYAKIAVRIHYYTGNHDLTVWCVPIVGVEKDTTSTEE